MQSLTRSGAAFFVLPAAPVVLPLTRRSRALLRDFDEAKHPPSELVSVRDPQRRIGVEELSRFDGKKVVLATDKSLARTDQPYRAPAGVRDWDESKHPRAPAGGPGGGEFTSGGGGDASDIAFVSPNISNLTFAQAVSALDSPRQKQLAKASDEIDNAVGISSTNQRVIGAWADGAENSMMVTAKGASPAAIRAASAMKGWLADQKAVLVFHPAKDGQEVFANFDATGDVHKIHDSLLKDGVVFHTLEPIGENKYRVHVYATDNATIGAIKKAAQHYDNATVEFTPGTGEFIGTKLETGSDREQRDDARRVYAETVREIANSGGLGGRDLEALWNGIRDYWGARLDGNKPAAAATQADDASGAGRGDAGGRGRATSPEQASRAATTAAGGYAPLVGLSQKPIKIGGDEFYVPGPYGKAKDAAAEYMHRAGMAYNPPREYVKVDPARATRIADAYENMKHDPDDPAVKASYDALANEVLAQWQVVKETGLQIDWMKPDQPDPYAKSLRMAAMDVTQNNHLWVFPTVMGYGSGDAETEAARSSNPMLRDTGESVGGHKMLVNDVFRIVHDYFGHFKEGVGFRADGEDNAWRSHASMFSDKAMPALTSETRGQNSWVNYGPSAKHNKTASPADTVYAPQKIGLMPGWTANEGRADPKKAYACQGGASGGMLAGIWKPTPEGRKQALLGGFTPQVFYELTNQGAARFCEAAKQAGARWLKVAPDLRLFLTPDGKAGFALKAGTILLDFQHPRAELRKFPDAVQALAASTKDWDEEKHPRVPAGEPGGGEFTSGGGGGGGASAEPVPLPDKPKPLPAVTPSSTAPAPTHSVAPPVEPAPAAAPSSPPLAKPSSGGASTTTTTQPASASTAGSSAESGGGKKKKAELADFSKADIALDSATTVDSEKRQKFLTQWNDKIGEAPDEFKQEFLGGLPATMHIQYADRSDQMEIRGTLLSASGGSIGSYTRTIDFKKNKASSDYFKIHDDKQGGGIGKKLLAANVEMYQKLGLEKVDVHANIDVGGYAWARYGYVPTQRSWDELRDKLLDKLDRGSARSGGYTPESWDEISEYDQDAIKDAWMRSTRDDFIQSEIESWRDSGQALNQAKEELAENFQISSGGHREYPEWAFAGLETWHDKLPDDAKIPFTDKQILDSVWVRYSGRYGEGREDPDIEFADAKLTEPAGYDPRQQTLPGIEPVKPHELLTQDMRDGIEKELIKSFNHQADSNAGDAEPPDFSDSVEEYQSESWDSMRDRDKYAWAEGNGSLPEIEPEAEEGEEIEDPEDAEAEVAHLLNSRDPKAIWAVADSSYGKALLKNSDWSGTIDFSDKETMERFQAYVGRKR